MMRSSRQKAITKQIVKAWFPLRRPRFFVAMLSAIVTVRGPFLAVTIALDRSEHIGQVVLGL